MKNTLKITNRIYIPINEIEWSAVRAQGPGGQHVNKASTAVHLRFDIKRSSLPEYYQKRLLQLRDQRLSREGIIIIKAQQHRSQEKNREDALNRLREIIVRATFSPRKRKATRPTRNSQTRRLDRKIKRGRIKATRTKVSWE
jgi:ribosome-associated protein